MFSARRGDFRVQTVQTHTSRGPICLVFCYFSTSRAAPRRLVKIEGVTFPRENTAFSEPRVRFSGQTVPRGRRERPRKVSYQARLRDATLGRARPKKRVRNRSRFFPRVFSVKTGLEAIFFEPISSSRAFSRVFRGSFKSVRARWQNPRVTISAFPVRFSSSHIRNGPDAARPHEAPLVPRVPARIFGI